MIIPRTLKGFRDFLPADARKRQYVINILKKVFESYGFEPLETPVLEYEEILAGKYGEEGDKLMYRFEDLGGRRVAMRYDQTVPLARVVAQYENQLAFPFKRYQIQPVWRADNTQRGRFREFLQTDIDTIGSNSTLADAEIIACIHKCLKHLGFDNFEIRINHRDTFLDLLTYIQGDQTAKEKIEYIIKKLSTSIDKLDKIGKDKVFQEIYVDEQLQKHLFAGSASNENLKSFLNLKPYTLSLAKDNENDILKPSKNLKPIIQNAITLGVSEDKIVIAPTLARGLDYYTGMIIEILIDGYHVGSVGGGGRYDNLISMFTEKQIPAVGFAFGFDRIIEAMNQFNLFPPEIIGSTTQVLITIFSEELKNKSLAISSELRNNNIKTEIYLGEIKEKNPLEKQLKYADQKGIPYVIILGPEEAEKNIVTLKNMKTREQKKLTIEEAISLLVTHAAYRIPSPFRRKKINL